MQLAHSDFYFKERLSGSKINFIL